VFWV
jgi:hypothetical protein